MFLKQDWVEFRVCLKTFNSKDVEIKHGPYISLKEIANKRSKRRSITLVRKVNTRAAQGGRDKGGRGPAAA